MMHYVNENMMNKNKINMMNEKPWWVVFLKSSALSIYVHDGLIHKSLPQHQEELNYVLKLSHQYWNHIMKR